MAETTKKLTKAIAWEKLPRPTNAYRGACPDGVETPRNVVMFPILTRQALFAGAEKSYQHHRFVLIVNLGTEGSVGLDGRWLRLREGEALLVFPYQIHNYGMMGGEFIRWIFMTFEMSRIESLNSLRGRVIVAGEDFGKMWEEAGQEWLRKRETSRRLPFLAGDLLEKLREKAGQRKTGTALNSRNTWLPRVHEKVLRPGLVDWRVKNLALQLGISNSRLRVAFRQESGESLGNYLRRLRMNRAAALLSGTTQQVGEIAVQCGYESLYSFSRSFGNAMGVSPREYRKKCLEGKV